MDIIPEARNTQDTIHRSSKKKKKSKTKVWMLWTILEWGTKYAWEKLQRQSMEQSVKE
jgi:hypothetical protein